MGIFDIFKSKEENHPAPAPTPTFTPTSASTSSENEVFLDLSKPGLLNLEKKQFLNLDKAEVSLNNLKASAGWGFSSRNTYDLDLCAFLYDSRNNLLHKVFFANKREKGIELDKDNLTGAGSGDDENIFINLSKVDSKVTTIALCVVIYGGDVRHQNFGGVKNAYVRLTDMDQNKEICRYSLTKDGGRHTAVHFADIIRTTDGWIFKAIGEYTNGSVDKVANNLF